MAKRRRLIWSVFMFSGVLATKQTGFTCFDTQVCDSFCIQDSLEQYTSYPIQVRIIQVVGLEIPCSETI